MGSIFDEVQKVWVPVTNLRNIKNSMLPEYEFFVYHDYSHTEDRKRYNVAEKSSGKIVVKGAASKDHAEYLFHHLKLTDKKQLRRAITKARKSLKQ